MPPTRAYPGRRAALGVVVALVALLAGGCALSRAQVDAVRQFSLSTAGVGDVAATELVAMRNATIAMNEQLLEIDAASPVDHGNLDAAFDVDDVEARVRAATVLRTYGELLLLLATYSQTEDIKKASDVFVASVGALAPEDRKLTDQQTEALGTVVTTIGGWIVERKKAKAVRRIVEDSEDQVIHLCKLLAADFDPNQAQLAAGFRTTIGSLKVAADGVIDRGSAVPNAERSRAVAGYRLASENEQRLKAVSERAASAVDKLATAQTALGEAMKTRKPTLDQIKAFASEAQALYNALEVFRKDSQSQV